MKPMVGKLIQRKGRMAKLLHFYTFTLFTCFCFMSQGCSLLFVVKGKTSVNTAKMGKIPQADSLEKKIGEKIVLHYKVHEGDTLDMLAEAFYGKASFKKKLAQKNHLKLSKHLKPGTDLKIADPTNFPDKSTLDRLREKWTALAQAKPSTTTTPVLAASEPDTTQDEKDVEKIPRPRVNKAFASGEKLKFEVRAIGVLGDTPPWKWGIT